MPDTTDTIKDYLTLENGRNHRHAKLYERLIKLAYGDDYEVLIGHHINFQLRGHVETINEIPSADTLIFDKGLMTKVFGSAEADRIMLLCAMCDECSGHRERIIEEALAHVHQPG